MKLVKSGTVNLRIESHCETCEHWLETWNIWKQWETCYEIYENIKRLFSEIYENSERLVMKYIKTVRDLLWNIWKQCKTDEFDFSYDYSFSEKNQETWLAAPNIKSPQKLQFNISSNFLEVINLALEEVDSYVCMCPWPYFCHLYCFMCFLLSSKSYDVCRGSCLPVLFICWVLLGWKSRCYSMMYTSIGSQLSFPFSYLICMLLHQRGVWGIHIIWWVSWLHVWNKCSDLKHILQVCFLF